MSPSSNSFDELPEELKYLHDISVRYKSYMEESAGREEEFVKKITKEQLEELRALYEEVDRRGDAIRWSEVIFRKNTENWRKWKAWSKQCEDTDVELPEPTRDNLADVLMALFSVLSYKGIHPFSSGRVQYIPPLDWSNLPPRLNYLIPIAMKWQAYQSHEQLDELATKITVFEFDELQELAARLRANGDGEIAAEWGESYDFICHPEAELLFSFIRLLEAFFPADGSLGLYEQRYGDEC